MSENLSLDLTASFAHVISPTPFGIYDADSDFIAGANGLVTLAERKLGGSILGVELTNRDVYACFEEATFEYSAMINAYHAKSILADILGAQTGTLDGQENKFVRNTLSLAKRESDAYSSEALVGGTRPLYSASIDLKDGQQNYDLNVLLSGSGVILDGERAEIREIFHFSPTAAYRFFDTTSAVNYLHNQFSFESFTPETIFYLLPIWEDVLRAQQLEQSHRIRRSNYSYNIVNNVLRLYPVPTRAIKLHFTYYKQGSTSDDAFASTDDPLVTGIANLSNVPFGNIGYSSINSMGHQWIRRFAMSLIKETLGRVRRKVNTVPIPNGDLTLDGAELVAEAIQEQLMLKDELRELLESMTYAELAQREAEMADNTQKQISRVPMGIFVG